MIICQRSYFDKYFGLGIADFADSAVVKPYDDVELQMVAEETLSYKE